MFALIIQHWGALSGGWVTTERTQCHNLATAVDMRRKYWENSRLGDPEMRDIRTGSDWTSSDRKVRAVIRPWFA